MNTSQLTNLFRTEVEVGWTEERQSALRHGSTMRPRSPDCFGPVELQKRFCHLPQYSGQVLPLSHGSSWDWLHIQTFSSFITLPFLLLLSQTGICQMCTCTPHRCGHRGNGSAQPIGVTDTPNPLAGSIGLCRVQDCGKVQRCSSEQGGNADSVAPHTGRDR